MISPADRLRERLPRDTSLVYLDEDIVVLDKPVGVYPERHPSPQSRQPTLLDAINSALRRPGRTEGGFPPPAAWMLVSPPVDQSGLALFARSRVGVDRLRMDFRQRRLTPVFTAVVEGRAGKPNDTRTHQSLLRRDPETRRTVTVDPNDAVLATAPGTAPAVTHIRVIDAPAGEAQVGGGGVGGGGDTATGESVVYSLVQARPESAWADQVLVHLRELGYPIAGDRANGAKTDPLGRVAMHLSELQFVHPRTNKAMRLRSVPPATFRAVASGGGIAAGDVAAVVDDDVSGATTDVGDLASSSSSSVAKSAAATAWGGSVARWYDTLLDERGSDHHEKTILPGLIRLLSGRDDADEDGAASDDDFDGDASDVREDGVFEHERAGERAAFAGGEIAGSSRLAGLRVLDLACGQGVGSRAIAERGAEVVGVDAAAELIEAAKSHERLRVVREGQSPIRYVVGDAVRVGESAEVAEHGPFDAAVCVMALTNIDPLGPMLEGVASALKPGGRFVAILSHPAFRIAGETSWGFSESRDAQGKAHVRQYRRVDSYLSESAQKIAMHPGAAPDVTTTTFHRPVCAYVNAFAGAGLLVDRLEEWASSRLSKPGPRANEENRARAEIPMFLAIRGVKV